MTFFLRVTFRFGTLLARFAVRFLLTFLTKDLTYCHWAEIKESPDGTVKPDIALRKKRLTMQTYSLKKFTGLMSVLLLIVTLGSAGAGWLVVQNQFETETQRAQADAERHAQQVATTLGNQLAFYQNIVNILARRSELNDIVSFGEEEAASKWAQQVRRLLPDALGATLSYDNGQVLGDPTTQRIGPICEIDLKHFANDELESYPPVHTNVAGLEHFDILGNLSGGSSGALLISFRLETLSRSLRRDLRDGESLALFTTSGKRLAQAGNTAADYSTVEAPVPGSDWILQLQHPPIAPSHIWLALFAVNLLMVIVVIALISGHSKRFSNAIQHDVHWIQRNIARVLDGRLQPLNLRLKTAEINQLTPEINALTEQLQDTTDQLRYTSLTDPLTHLHNRRHFDAMLAHAFERSLRRSPDTLLVIDINKFKEINDLFGHHEGDRFLVDIAASFRKATRQGDMISRLGGDEFAIILEGLTPIEVEKWVRRFAKRFDELMAANKPEGAPAGCGSLSIGVVAISAQLFTGLEAVIKAGDHAMYQAKRKISNESRFQVDSSLHRVANHINTASTT